MRLLLIHYPLYLLGLLFHRSSAIEAQTKTKGGLAPGHSCVPLGGGYERVIRKKLEMIELADEQSHRVWVETYGGNVT